MVMAPVYALAPVSFLFRLAALRGRLDWYWPRGARRQVLEALERALAQEGLGPDELRRVARRHFEYRRRHQLARVWPQVRGFAGAERIPVEGLAHLDRALAGGKGAILVTAHFGHGRLIKPILRSRERDALVVGVVPRDPSTPDFPPAFSRLGSFVHSRVLRLPRWSRYDPRWRETVGEDLPATMNLRPQLAALARNQTLIIVADGRNAARLVSTRLLGLTIRFTPGAFSLARATGAPLLPAFVTDNPHATDPIGLRLLIQPPLQLQNTNDPNADLHTNTQRFAQAVAAQIHAHPHLWGQWSAMAGTPGWHDQMRRR
jgi:lauroyl/myristoyl acyltransferase